MFYKNKNKRSALKAHTIHRIEEYSANVMPTTVCSEVNMTVPVVEVCAAAGTFVFIATAITSAKILNLALLATRSAPSRKILASTPKFRWRLKTYLSGSAPQIAATVRRYCGSVAVYRIVSMTYSCCACDFAC